MQSTEKRMRPRADQLDLFSDIPTAKRKPGRPRKELAEVIAFPMTRDQRAVRQMADLMSAMRAEDRSTFWRAHTRRLIREKQDAGVPYEAAYAAVMAYTQAVYRLTVFLDADRPRLGARRLTLNPGADA